MTQIGNLNNQQFLGNRQYSELPSSESGKAQIQIHRGISASCMYKVYED